eukprot:scaffold280730_cov48-Prasinocladus_malaysianus.AAC.2
MTHLMVCAGRQWFRLADGRSTVTPQSMLRQMICLGPDLVEAVDDEQVFLLVELLADVLIAPAERRGKPLIEGAYAVEERREHKVEEGPKLLDGILNGGACQQEAVPEAIVRPQDVRQLGRGVLQPVALVHHQQLVLKLLQVRLVPAGKTA